MPSSHQQINQLQQQHHTQSINYLSQLPREILIEILRYVEPKDRHKLLRVCKYMHQLTLEHLLGPTYAQAREFLYFQRKELKHLDQQIQKFTKQAKESLFDTKRLDYPATIQYHLLNFSGFALVLHAIRIAHGNSSRIQVNIDAYALPIACFLLGIGILAANSIITKNRSLAAPIIDNDYAVVKQSPILESIISDSTIPLVTPSLAQYEVLLVTAQQIAHKHLHLLEKRFKMAPPTGKHSFNIEKLSQYMGSDRALKKYATNTFHLWKKEQLTSAPTTNENTPNIAPQL